MMTLLDAVQEGAADKVTNLLQSKGCTANDIIDGRSLLSWACQLGHADVATILLNFGANPNLADFSQSVCTSTPLHEAVGATQPETVHILLSHGANPNVLDGHARTPLTLLVIQETYAGRNIETQQIANALLGHGAKIDSVLTVCAYGDERLLEQMLLAGVDVESLIEPVWLTGLHVSAALGNLACLKLLCSFMPDLNPMDWEHRTPLDVTHDPSVSEYLVQHGGKRGEELEIFPEPRPLIFDLLMRGVNTEQGGPDETDK